MPIFGTISQSVNEPNANVAAEVIGLESQNKIVNAISKYQYYLYEFPTLKNNLFSNNLVLEIGSSVLGSINTSIIIKTHILRRPQKI